MKNLARSGRLIIIIILFVGFFLLKTGSANTNTLIQATLENTEPPDPDTEIHVKDEVGVVSQTTEKGIQLRISSDKAVYQPGEIVYITASVENLSDLPQKYTLWNIEDPAIYVYLDETPYAEGQALYEKDYQEKESIGEVASELLPAKQRIAREVVWNQQLFTYPDPIEAPTGNYRIHCEFFIGSYSTDIEPVKLSTSVEIRVENAKIIITPDEAIAIARRAPDVESWYNEHSGPNLVKYENNQYYLYFESGWERASPDTTVDGMTLEEFRQSYEPAYNALMVDNIWQVRFFTKFGAPPNVMIVNIEPTTGKILSFGSSQ
jgi:hypothetical protein